jgi:hypothetical protein
MSSVIAYSLPELLEASFSPPRGRERGHCIVCGRRVDDGFPARLKENFTAHQWLQAFPDGVFCPACHWFMNTPEVRRHHWILSREGIRYITREEGWKLVWNPPQPPFALYFSRTGKKHGWLRLVHKITTARNSLWIGWDEDIIYMNPQSFPIAWLDVYLPKVKEAGVTKKELLSEWTLKHIEEHYNEWKKLKALKGTKKYEFLVWLLP